MSVVDDAWSLIVRTCTAQGVPLTVTDPVALARVAAIFHAYTVEAACSPLADIETGQVATLG